MDRRELLNRHAHLKEEITLLERRNNIDCECRPICWCHDKPYSLSGIDVLKTRIEEIKTELHEVWDIRVI